MDKDFEVYEGLTSQNRKKKYLVADWSACRIWLINNAKRFFHVSQDKIICLRGWIYKQELYLEDPHKKGAKHCWVAYLR